MKFYIHGETGQLVEYKELVIYDEIMQRAVSKFIPADDLIVPYYATDLKDCERITHVVRMSENDVIKKQKSGFYRDVELIAKQPEQTSIQQKLSEIEGVKPTGELDNQYNILEMHVDLDLEEFERTDKKDKNILCIATKQETAKNMVTKVKFMFENLPSWLKITAEENNKLTLRLSNGSQVKAVSAAGDAGRSEAVSLLIIDEAAFIDGIGEIWASAQQTLATGGGAIVLSTPYGTGNWFHQTWVKAESGENQFLPIKLPWYVHPERDETWRRHAGILTVK